MKVFELKKLLAEKRSKASAIARHAFERNLSPDERTEFDTLMQEVLDLKQRVEDLEAIEADEAPADDQVATEEPARRSKPIALEERNQGPAVHTKGEHRYSLLRAIRQQFTPGARFDGYEAEVSQEIARRTGVNPQGFYLPMNIAFRALNATTGAGAVATYTDTTLIEFIRNRAVVIKAGARLIDGLNGRFVMPKMTAGSSAYWVADCTAPTASSPTIGSVTFSPHTMGTYVDICREFMLQTSIDAEQETIADLGRSLSTELDRAAFNGAGTGAEPLGLFQDPSVPAIALGTNGAAPTYAALVSMEAAVTGLDVDLTSLAYVTNGKGLAAFKTTPAAGTFPVFLWNNGLVNGYPVYVTGNVPSNLTKGTGTGLSGVVFGPWNDFVVASWGPGLDILVDPYTLSSSGGVRVRALWSVDLHARHPEFFCRIVDMIA